MPALIRFLPTLPRLLRIGLGCGLLMLSAARAAEPAHILLLLSEPHAPYQRFREAFERDLPRGTRLEVRELAEQEGAPPHADLLLAVGTKAAQWAVINTNSPLLATMLTRSDFERLPVGRDTARLHSALYIDQPPSRQAALIRAALPGRSRVGVLYADGDVFSPEPLRQALHQRSLQLVLFKRQADSSLAADLDGLLLQSEVLLAVPDSEIYNPFTIRNILLSSYRRNVPLIGLSAAYVNAGALCAVYSTPEQLAGQAVHMAGDFLKAGRLPPPQYPQLYEVGVNATVARSLRLDVHSAEVLRIEIEHLSGGRHP